MTTLTIEEDIKLNKTTFLNLSELEEYIYEELLERKMQQAIKEDDFVNF